MKIAANGYGQVHLLRQPAQFSYFAGSLAAVDNFDSNAASGTKITAQGSQFGAGKPIFERMCQHRQPAGGSDCSHGCSQFGPLGFAIRGFAIAQPLVKRHAGGFGVTLINQPVGKMWPADLPATSQPPCPCESPGHSQSVEFFGDPPGPLFPQSIQ